jgi:hypothetical protein
MMSLEEKSEKSNSHNASCTGECYHWAIEVNSIIIDYTKTPLRLSELKPILSVLKEVMHKDK